MNSYIEDKKQEAAAHVETTITAVMNMFGFTREVAIEKVLKACKSDYSDTRIKLNGFSQYDTDDRVVAMREQCLIKSYMVEYAEKLNNDITRA